MARRHARMGCVEAVGQYCTTLSANRLPTKSAAKLTWSNAGTGIRRALGFPSFVSYPRPTVRTSRLQVPSWSRQPHAGRHHTADLGVTFEGFSLQRLDELEDVEVLVSPSDLVFRIARVRAYRAGHPDLVRDELVEAGDGHGPALEVGVWDTQDVARDPSRAVRSVQVDVVDGVFRQGDRGADRRKGERRVARIRAGESRLHY